MTQTDSDTLKSIKSDIEDVQSALWKLIKNGDVTGNVDRFLRQADSKIEEALSELGDQISEAEAEELAREE